MKMVIPQHVIETRIRHLRNALAEKSLDALVLINDEKRGWENVYYLSGFRGSSAVLTITHDEAFLTTDSRYVTQASSQCCVEVREMQPGESQIESMLRLVRVMRLTAIAFDEASVSAQTYLKIANCPAKWHIFASQLARMRRHKDDWEVGCIKKACRIASQAYLDALSQVRVGMTELEFSKLLELAIAKHEGEGVWHNSDMIVASGTRSAMPHGTATSKEMAPGDQVTVDYGSIYGGYMSDITRNFSLGRLSHPEFHDIHDVLLSAHQAAASLLRPGVAASEVHKAAQNVITKAGYGAYFRHALGHSFGLEIHESPHLSLRSNEILEVGDVVTVEPGIYIPERGGLRLEDDYLIVKDGAECLTRDLPQEFVHLQL